MPTATLTRPPQVAAPTVRRSTYTPRKKGDPTTPATTPDPRLTLDPPADPTAHVKAIATDLRAFAREYDVALDKATVTAISADLRTMIAGGVLASLTFGLRDGNRWWIAYQYRTNRKPSASSQRFDAKGYTRRPKEKPGGIKRQRNPHGLPFAAVVTLGDDWGATAARPARGDWAFEWSPPLHLDTTRRTQQARAIAFEPRGLVLYRTFHAAIAFEPGNAPAANVVQEAEAVAAAAEAAAPAPEPSTYSAPGHGEPVPDTGGNDGDGESAADPTPARPARARARGPRRPTRAERKAAREAERDATAADLLDALQALKPARWTKHGRDRVYVNDLAAVFDGAKTIHGYGPRGVKVYVDTRDRTLGIRLITTSPEQDPAAMRAAVTAAVLDIAPTVKVAA